MKALLEWLWSGCWHRWLTREVIETSHTRANEAGVVVDSWVSRDHILQCARCGRVRRRNLGPTR